MREVARRAGVSLATVSYVLNRGPRPVSARLQERVQAAAAELGYRPAGRGRARVRTATVGVVVPDATNSFFSRALGAAEQALAAEGYLVVVGSSHDDPDRELQLVRRLLRARVDGLLLTPVGRVPAPVEQAAAGGLPVVVMDRDGGSRLSRVSMNDYGSAFQAVRVLAESGHQRIALVNGSESISTAAERLRGYRESLALAELPFRPEYVRLGAFSFEHGRQATRELMALPEPPEAIFSTSAILTSGVLSALREQRLRWPEDVAVIGFGDAVWASLVSPPMTVIEQPIEQMGETAARLLLAGGGGGQQVVLDCRLVLRESHWRSSIPVRHLEVGEIGRR
jgi:LacI family transcriptional regulator